MSRRRGNPNWGKPGTLIPSGPTEFEMYAKRLGLSKESYIGSRSLRNWCEHNKNRLYVPEWLLQEWGIVPYISFG